MRRLADLLSGVPEAVIYRVNPDHDLDDLVTTVRDAGWRLVHLDTVDATGKAGILDRFQAAFGFPDWFGHNLDALADALSDVRAEPGVVLLWDHSAGFAGADREQFDAVLNVLTDRAERQGIGQFVTLLRG